MKKISFQEGKDIISDKKEELIEYGYGEDAAEQKAYSHLEKYMENNNLEFSYDRD